jgi:ubiquinone biosynthesis accessory factor UbiJ
LLSHAVVAPVNHVLRGESWALKRLAPFAGRTARVDILPFSATFTVRDSGEIGPAAPAAEADLRIRLTPAVAARILAGDSAAYDEISAEGDGEFAQAIRFVVRNARWDVEEDLSRVFGDALAHRVVGAGRAVLQLQARAAGSLARNLSEYWLEERPLVARRTDVAHWVREVDILRDDVERLAQRIERL